MNNCYKNFPVKVNYSDSSTAVIYGNSTSLSENLELEHALSLGIKGSNSVFCGEVPKGNLTVQSYLVDDLNIYNNLKGSNDQSITIDFGPYHCPAPCVLNSMSISINVDDPITVDRNFNYFGGVSVGVSPTPQNPELNPVIVENISLSGFDQLQGTENITSISWSFNQTYNNHHLLGNIVPLITFGQGTIELEIEGEGLAEKLTRDSCVLPPKEYAIQVSGCGGKDLGSLKITGFLQSRSSRVSSESDELNSVSILQFL